MPDLQFHHFGLAVREPEPSRKILRALGYTIGDAVFDPGQHAHVQLCTHPSAPAVEIIYSDDPASPLRAILDRQDESIYHICYRTPSIDNALEALRQTGQRVMRMAAACPAPLFAGHPVAFYYVRGLGLIELLEDSDGV